MTIVACTDWYAPLTVDVETSQIRTVASTTFILVASIRVRGLQEHHVMQPLPTDTCRDILSRAKQVF